MLFTLSIECLKSKCLFKISRHETLSYTKILLSFVSVCDLIRLTRVSHIETFNRCCCWYDKVHSSFLLSFMFGCNLHFYHFLISHWWHTFYVFWLSINPSIQSDKFNDFCRRQRASLEVYCSLWAHDKKCRKTGTKCVCVIEISCHSTYIIDEFIYAFILF